LLVCNESYQVLYLPELISFFWGSLPFTDI
jgi:hypothetical protein